MASWHLVVAGLAPLLVSHVRPGAAISIGDAGAGLLGRGLRQGRRQASPACQEGPFGCPTETTATSIVPGSWGALDSPDGLVIDTDTGGKPYARMYPMRSWRLVVLLRMQTTSTLLEARSAYPLYALIYT